MTKQRIQIFLEEEEIQTLQQIKKENDALSTMNDSALLRYLIKDYYNLTQTKRKYEQGKEISMILNIVSKIGDHLNILMGDNEDSMTFRFAQDYVQRKLNLQGRVRYKAPTPSQKDEILHVNSYKEAPKVEKIDTSTEEGYRRWKEIQREEEEKIARARKEREEQEKRKSIFDDDDDWLKDF